MPITIVKGKKERSDELKQFKEEMIAVIRKIRKEMEEEKEKKKQEKQQKEAKNQAEEQAKKERENSSINRAITTAIQDIEKVMSEKEIKIEELGEYSNYKEQINSLTRV